MGDYISGATSLASAIPVGASGTEKGQETEGKASHIPELHNSMTQSHCPRLLPSEC